MSTNLTMPRLSDTMTTGKVLSWKKNVGDKVAPGDVLAEIESDKATMEFEAFEDGVILSIVVPEGESAPIDAVLAVLGEAGEQVVAPAAPAAAKETKKVEEKPKPEAKKAEKVAAVQPAPQVAPVPTSVPTPAPKPVSAPPKPVPVPATVVPIANGARIIASPVAMRLAAELGIDLRNITGTGPDGRITRVDIETASGGKTVAVRTDPVATPSTTPVKIAESLIRPSTPTPTPKAGTEPLSQMRSAIARRMTEGWQAPMFTVTVEVRMDRIVDLRKQWKELESEHAPSINDFIVSACARALVQFPRVNARLSGEAIEYHEKQDIGVAVALDDGLITPVIRDAANKSLQQISIEAHALSKKAKDRKLQPDEFTGCTFTVSNLGMFDVVHFTAIVNPPEAAILAVGSVRETPVVDNGELAIENRMMMTLSGDHRVIDGATGAKFLGVVRHLLENPLALL